MSINYDFISTLPYSKEYIFFESNNKDVFYCETKHTECVCPHCKTITTKVKDRRLQSVQMVAYKSPTNIARYTYRVHKKRFYCPKCKRSFAEPLPGVARYQRVCNDIKSCIITECSETCTYSSIAARWGFSTTTIMRYFDAITYDRPAVLPPVISIDEFKGNAHKKRFQVAVAAPISHTLLDILPDRNVADICRYFWQFPQEQRDRVQYVVMDMSSLFRDAIRRAFPNALIVSDRFHFFRLVNWSMNAVRRRIQQEFAQQGKYFKRKKYLLCKDGMKLEPEEAVEVRSILAQSDELRDAYALKEAFNKIKQMHDHASAKDFLER